MLTADDLRRLRAICDKLDSGGELTAEDREAYWRIYDAAGEGPTAEELRGTMLDVYA
jgi:hypothetical protein